MKRKNIIIVSGVDFNTLNRDSQSFAVKNVYAVKDKTVKHSTSPCLKVVFKNGEFKIK